MDHPAEAAKLKIDGDVVRASQDLLIYFYKEINKHPELKNGRSHVINNAIRRYETCWLPLLKETPDNVKLVPPIDIEWIWYVHMLSPYNYREDCMTLVGEVLDHRILGYYPREDGKRLAGIAWSKMYGDDEPYKFELISPSQSSNVNVYKSHIKYDLAQAVDRQAGFYYNVSLPHYNDVDFRREALERYKKFLYLKKLHPQLFTVPMYDVDLIWHTHQLHPIIYHRDTEFIFGGILNHDDTVSDRSPGSHLSTSDAETRSKWKETFDEPFEKPGCMYRGESAAGKLFEVPAGDRTPFASKQADVTLTRVSIVKDFGCGKRILKVRFKDRKLTINHGCCAATSCEGELMHFQVNNAEKDKLVFQLSRKCDFLCFCAYETHFAQGGFQFDQLIGSLSDATIIEETLSIGPTVDVSFQTSITQPELGPAIFKVDLGAFETYHMPESATDQFWGPFTLPRQMANMSDSSTCIAATHRIKSAIGAPDFVVKILHSKSYALSAIQVFYKDKMVVLGHTIGTDQLPDSSKKFSSECAAITLCTEKGERAIILKNSIGDCTVVKARWEGFVNAPPPKRAFRGKRKRKVMPKNDPGYLQVEYAELGRGMSYNTEPRAFKVRTHRHYGSCGTEFSIRGVSVDLGSGEISLPTNRLGELAEHLALAFSVAVLYVLCQPRPVPEFVSNPETDYGIDSRKNNEVSLGAAPKRKEKIKTGRKKTFDDETDYMFLLATGYEHDTPCNPWIHNYCGVSCGDTYNVCDVSHDARNASGGGTGDSGGGGAGADYGDGWDIGGNSGSYDDGDFPSEH